MARTLCRWRAVLRFALLTPRHRNPFFAGIAGILAFFTYLNVFLLTDYSACFISLSVGIGWLPHT
jgi:hypothetical protein